MILYDSPSYPPLPSQPEKPVSVKLAEAHKFRSEMSESKFYKMLQTIYQSARDRGEPVDVPPPRAPAPRISCGETVNAATTLRDKGEISTPELYKRLNAIHGGGEVPTPKPNGDVATVSRIQRAVASHFNLTVEVMLSRGRPHRIMRPRQIAIYLCRKLTTRSLTQLGFCFGGRDHTTIIHAVRKIEKLITSDEAFAREVEEIKGMVGS